MSDLPPTVDERIVDAVLNAVRQAANVLCDRWSLLILVLAHAGVSRYQDFSLRGGMASRMLTTRLLLLEEHQIMVRVAYTRHPPRYDYFLSHKGLALFEVVATMARWESFWHSGSPGTTLTFEHALCGQREVHAVACCAGCEAPIAARDVRLRVDRAEVEPTSNQTQFRRSTLTTAGPGIQRRIPLAHAIDVFGDKWGIGVLVCLFMQVRTFGGFQAHTGMSTNILSERLARLTDLGIVRALTIEDGETRAGYALTDKGVDLYPILLAMQTWADTWLSKRYRSPIKLLHKPCQKILTMRVACHRCGKPMDHDNCRVLLSESLPDFHDQPSPPLHSGA